MTTSYTTHFRFGLPDFLSGPWHNDWYTLIHALDRALYEVVIVAGGSVWANSTAYTIGSIVISPEDGTLWSASVAHTSSASPTTFSQERVANPTFWNTLAATAASDVEFTPFGTIAATDVQSAIEEVVAETQPLDADLTAIAAITLTGVLVRTAADTWAVRTMIAPAAGFTISDPTVGNITFTLANDLAALEALASTGIAVRSASDTWVQRSMANAAAGITWTNPAGIAGDPTPVLANDLAALEALASAGFSVRTGTDAWTIRSLANAAAGITWTDADGVAGNPTPVLANDLAALESLGSTGFAARTAADTWAQRSLADAAAGITWTNPAGVAGNPTPVLANDLAALEGLGSTGFAARTAADTWAQRSLANASAGITWTNPAGMAGDPTPVLANDLAALEALSGTNTIYYRSASDTWTAVTINATLEFSSGTLQRAALTGDVTAAAASNSVVVNKASEAFALTGDISPAQITATQNDYNPTGLSTASVLRLNSDASRSITGLAGGSDGRIISIVNVGSFDITLENNDAGSTDANKFAFDDDLVLAANTGCGLIYDSTSSRWRLFAKAVAGGAGGGAPTTSQYVTLATDGSLTNERVLTAGDGIDLTDAGAGSTITVAAEFAVASDQETGTSLVKVVNPGIQHRHASALKAACRYNSAGTIAHNYNITNITDSGTGDWSINIANDFSAAGVSAGIAFGGHNNANTDGMFYNLDVATTAGVYHVAGFGDSSTSLVRRDPDTPDEIHFLVAGDQ